MAHSWLILLLTLSPARISTGRDEEFPKKVSKLGEKTHYTFDGEYKLTSFADGTEADKSFLLTIEADLITSYPGTVLRP